MTDIKPAQHCFAWRAELARIQLGMYGLRQIALEDLPEVDDFDPLRLADHIDMNLQRSMDDLERIAHGLGAETKT